jgi:hypothetical protein
MFAIGASDFRLRIERQNHDFHVSSLLCRLSTSCNNDSNAMESNGGD